MEMPIDNNSEAAPKNLQESEQTTRSSLWVLPETLRLGATIGLWTLAAVGLVLNLSALVCYFRTRRLTFTFQLPYITIGVNLFVNNLLLVVAILLAAVTLTFGHREASVISDGAQAFLTIHVLLQSWVSHVLSIFYEASAVHARPQKASETTKENMDDIPDAMKDQAGGRCNKLLSCLQVRLWRNQASEVCRQNGEGDASNISNEPQSRSGSSGSAGPSKHNTAWSLRWWLLWTWILSLLSGTALLLCSAVDDTRLSRTFNPFRRWYLVPQSGGTATQQGWADANVCSPRIPVLLAVLSVYVAGSLIITASVLRAHTICRLGHRLLAASFSATRGPHAEWQHKVTPRFKQRGQQDAQSADAAQNELHFRSRGHRDISSSSFSSDWEEPEWDVVSEEQESSCDVTAAGGVSTAQSLSSVCQERRGFTRNKGANGVEENSQEERDKVSVNFTVGCDDGDRENRMYDVTKQRPPWEEKKVSSPRKTSPGETMNYRTSFQNAGRSPADHADASWKGRKQPGLLTDGRKETADVEQEVDEHGAASSGPSTGGDSSPVLYNNATAAGVDKRLNEASLQNVNHNARNSPRARSWSAERSQRHSNVHLNRRRHGASSCDKSTIRMKGQRSNSCPDVASQLQGQISKRGFASSRDVLGQVSDSGQDPAEGRVGQMSEKCLVALSNKQITSCPQFLVEVSGQVSNTSEGATPHVHNQLSSNGRSPRQVFMKKTKASKRCYADSLEHGESKAVGRVSAKRAFLVNSESDEDMCCSYCSEETEVREDECGFHSTEDCQPSKAPASRTGRSTDQQRSSGQKVLTPRKRYELLLKERHLTPFTHREKCERKRKKRFASTKKCAGVLADPLVLAQAMDLLGLVQKGRVLSFNDNVNASGKRKSQRIGLSGGDMIDPSSLVAEDPSDDDLDRTSPSSSMVGDEFARRTSRHAIHRASQEYDKSASALDVETRTRESRIIAKGTRDRTTSRGSRLTGAAPSSMRQFTVRGARTSASQMAPTSWQSKQLSPPQLGSQTPAVWSRDSPPTYRRQIYERGQRYQFPEELTRAEMLDLEAGGTQGDLGDVVSSWVPGRSAAAAGTGFQEGATLFPNVHSGSAEWRHASFARKWDRDTEGDVLMNHVKRSHDTDLPDSVATGSNSFLWSGYPPSDTHSLQSHILPTQQDRLRRLKAGRSSPAGQADTCVDQLLMPFVEAPLPASAAAGYFYVPAYASRRTSQAEIGRQKSWDLVRKKTDNIANRAEDAFREDATDTSNSDLDRPADSGNTDVRSSWRRRAMQRFFKKLRNWNARWRAQRRWCVCSRRSENDVTVWEGGDTTGALFWVVLHAVTCIPFAVSLVPGVLDRASPEGRIEALMAVQFLLFSHVVACPLWLLWQHGFFGSRT